MTTRAMTIATMLTTTIGDRQAGGPARLADAACSRRIAARRSRLDGGVAGDRSRPDLFADRVGLLRGRWAHP